MTKRRQITVNGVLPCTLAADARPKTSVQPAQVRFHVCATGSFGWQLPLAAFVMPLRDPSHKQVRLVGPAQRRHMGFTTGCGKRPARSESSDLANAARPGAVLRNQLAIYGRRSTFA